ncbi:MAG: SPOR domain-containing protein [Bacteroidetes bacterium]|nr:SPOR domain-containing protein [Bacteroidota bacterium]
MENNKHRSLLIQLFASFIIFTGLSVPVKSWAQGTFYYLVAGSFKNFETATDMVNSLKTKGYNPQVLFPTNNSSKYRVSVYHSLNKKEVAAYATNLQKTDRAAKSYWVLELSNEEVAQEDLSSSKVKKRDLKENKKKDLGIDPNATSYHLVRGSMKTFEAAQEVVETLEERGYEPYLIFPAKTGDSYRIAVFASNNRKEVEAYANLLKKRGEPSGWILEEEPGLKSTLNTPISNANSRLMASESGATYHLIGGSFTHFEQASEYSESAKALGYDPLIMFPEPGKFNSFRVSIYRSTNKSDVVTYNKSITNSGKKGGWIYEQK